MLDFMREETTGYIEVGGPNNSVVVSPSGNIGKSSLEAPPAGRQTSFQRCCLHRLADRFGIVRETNENGMIRLVKVKGESAIPSKLLIDLDPSEYAVEETSSDVRGLSQKLSDTSIANKPKPQKMKIMKRSSSGLGSSSSLKSEGGKGNSSRNRKKLSDKEKAYAEARARIFNESGASDSGATSETATSPVGDVTQLVPSNVRRTASTSSLSTEPKSSATPPPMDQLDAEEKAAINKATYRNRKQEENDPDFQRLAGHSASHYGADVYAAPQQQQQYGYNPLQQQFYPQPYVATYAGNAASSQQYASYAVDGETYYQSAPSSPYYRGRAVRSLSRQNSASEKKADVNNLDEFPSLGA